MLKILQSSRQFRKSLFNVATARNFFHRANLAPRVIPTFANDFRSFSLLKEPRHMVSLHVDAEEEDAEDDVDSGDNFDDQTVLKIPFISDQEMNMIYVMHIKYPYLYSLQNLSRLTGFNVDRIQGAVILMNHRYEMMRKKGMKVITEVKFDDPQMPETFAEIDELLKNGYEPEWSDVQQYLDLSLHHDNDPELTHYLDEFGIPKVLTQELRESRFKSLSREDKIFELVKAVNFAGSADFIATARYPLPWRELYTIYLEFCEKKVPELPEEPDAVPYEKFTLEEEHDYFSDDDREEDAEYDEKLEEFERSYKEVLQELDEFEAEAKDISVEDLVESDGEDEDEIEHGEEEKEKKEGLDIADDEEDDGEEKLNEEEFQQIFDKSFKDEEIALLLQDKELAELFGDKEGLYKSIQEVLGEQLSAPKKSSTYIADVVLPENEFDKYSEPTRKYLKLRRFLQRYNLGTLADLDKLIAAGKKAEAESPKQVVNSEIYETDKFVYVGPFSIDKRHPKLKEILQQVKLKDPRELREYLLEQGSGEENGPKTIAGIKVREERLEQILDRLDRANLPVNSSDLKFDSDSDGEIDSDSEEEDDDIENDSDLEIDPEEDKYTPTRDPAILQKVIAEYKTRLERFNEAEKDVLASIQKFEEDRKKILDDPSLPLKDDSIKETPLNSLETVFAAYFIEDAKKPTASLNDRHGIVNDDLTCKTLFPELFAEDQEKARLNDIKDNDDILRDEEEEKFIRASNYFAYENITIEELTEILDNVEDHLRRMRNVAEVEDETVYAIWELEERGVKFEIGDAENEYDGPKRKSIKNGYFPSLLGNNYEKQKEHLKKRILEETKAEYQYDHLHYAKKAEESLETMPKGQSSTFEKPSRWKLAYRDLSKNVGPHVGQQSPTILTRTGQ
jgi:hypothetical protein